MQRQKSRERKKVLKERGVSWKYNPSVIGKASTAGITLIALVVTTVVLLILAGITIIYLWGENGIIAQANKAKDQYESAKDLETVHLAVEAGKLENLTKGTQINAAIQNELRQTDSEATVEGNGEEKDITYNKKNYKINVKTGSIEKGFEKPEYNEAMQSLKQGDLVIYNTNVEGVGETLGIVLHEASSEYGLQIALIAIKESIVLGDKTDFRESYNNAIQTLNSVASKYKNSQYALDARAFGSNPKNKNAENNETIKVESDGEIIDTQCKGSDENYNIDVEAVEKIDVELPIEPVKDIWIASRELEESSMYNMRIIDFRVRAIYSSKSLGAWIGLLSSNQPQEKSIWPCILLRGDLKITKGNGKDIPYELGV